MLCLNEGAIIGLFERCGCNPAHRVVADCLYLEEGALSPSRLVGESATKRVSLVRETEGSLL
jgi:hypothetical protein